MHHLSPFHNNNGGYLQANQQRRPSLQQAQSPVGLGGLGGGPTLGLSGRTGKSGLTFDHILSRLQNELQKSRETGSELNSLAGVITDINDNLVGGAHVRTSCSRCTRMSSQTKFSFSHQHITPSCHCLPFAPQLFRHLLLPSPLKHPPHFHRKSHRTSLISNHS